MNDRNFPAPRQNVNHNQVVLQSKLRVSQSGVEMLDFVIPLGMMELHCSCPIPDEGTEGSPVYIHIRPARTGEPRQPRQRHGGVASPRTEEDDDYGNRGTHPARAAQ